ncbi:hypothetical protein EJD97_001350 [Solanum chilense]|uniref:At2g35280-like TPR domain-containing protein n=1 Tax=Solanum chilense TaxID=4083 RepID=A0A6N2AUQ5_SOLCI|nr:hypothetical protein EJD97_001350 [Solanum chilense]
MVSTRKSLFESLPTELVILIIERFSSYSLEDLVSVKLCSRFLNEVGNERSEYQKITLASFPTEPIWTRNQHVMSVMKICIASENLEALYRKGYFNFFNRNDPTALRMVKKAEEGVHRGVEYVLAVISIFEGGISMIEGLMYIANMKKICHL